MNSSSNSRHIEFQLIEESFNKAVGYSQDELIDLINDLAIDILQNEKDENITSLDTLSDYLEALDIEIDYCSQVHEWYNLAQYIITHLLAKPKYTILLAGLMHLMLCLFTPTKLFIIGKENELIELLKNEASFKIVGLIQQAIECGVFDTNVILEKGNLDWMKKKQNIYGVLMLNIVLKSSEIANENFNALAEWYICNLTEKDRFTSEYLSALLYGLYYILTKNHAIIIEKIIKSNIYEKFREFLYSKPKEYSRILAIIMFEISSYKSCECDLCNVLIENMVIGVRKVYMCIIKECIEGLLANKIDKKTQ